MYRVTHSLLSAWDYATGEKASDNSLAEFMSTLRREPRERTKAMQDGIDFEDEVTFYAANGYLKHDDAPKMQVVTAMGDTIIQDVHAYTDAERKAIIRFGKRVRFAVPQVRAEKRMTINGMDFLLVGVADYLKAGIIYDTKRVGMYEYGRYVGNTQHPVLCMFVQIMRKLPISTCAEFLFPCMRVGLIDVRFRYGKFSSILNDNRNSVVCILDM